MGDKEVKVKRNILVACLLFSSACSFAQEIIQAEKETLGRTTIGKGKGQVEYFSDEEGFFSPNGPFVDGNGILYFFPTYDRRSLITFDGKKFQNRPLTENIPDFDKLISTGYTFTSQEGTIGSPGNGLTFNFYNNKFRAEPFDWGEEKVRAYDYSLTPVPHGMFLESQSKKVLLVAEFLKTGDIEIHSGEDLKSWLQTQPGGFSIGEDGLLYKNGMLWSVAKKPTYGEYEYEYRGRLISGHVLWSGGGSFNSPGQFIISDTRGNVEVVIDLPWRKSVEDEWYQYDYGVGPWGEIYWKDTIKVQYQNTR